jgi:hypothetical protein
MRLGLFFAGLAVEDADEGVRTEVAVLGAAVVPALASCCWSG